MYTGWCNQWFNGWYLVVRTEVPSRRAGPYWIDERVIRDTRGCPWSGGIPAFKRTGVDCFVRSRRSLAQQGGKKAASYHAVNSSVTAQPDSQKDKSVKTQESMATYWSPPAYRCLACDVSPPPRIRDCQVFIALTPTQPYHLVKKESRCVRCITGRHKAVDCEHQTQCEVDDCSQRHHPLLHGADGLHVIFDSTPEDALVAVGFRRPHHSVLTVLHQVAPVVVYGENEKTRATYAFLDSESDATFIVAHAAKEFGLRGPRTKLCSELF